MSEEAFAYVQEMDMEDVEIQLILQCAPLFAGLKPSNLLNIRKEEYARVWHMLEHTGISCYTFLDTGQKVTALLFDREELTFYLSGQRVRCLLREYGYENGSLDELLCMFRMRYIRYMSGGSQFPHEMGLFLGYPVEDVEGFVKFHGKNFLCNGYWKVYDNVQEKVRLFRKFEEAEEMLIQLILNGFSIEQIIQFYRERQKDVLAV